MKCLDEDSDRHGGIESESFIADNTNIGQMDGKVFCDKWDMLVFTYQNSDVSQVCSLFLKSLNGFC